MLTDKQEKFAQCVALEGMSLSDAYRSAYPMNFYMNEKNFLNAEMQLRMKKKIHSKGLFASRRQCYDA